VTPLTAANDTAMKLLFVHQNFPGQFKYLAPALAARPGVEARALHMRADLPARAQGIDLIGYRATRGTTPGVHPWVGDFETKTIRGEACFHAARALRDTGYMPDAIIAHPGWGESLFLKELWPRARLGIYCEFFYLAQGADVGFDPEFPVDEVAEACRIRLKNLNNFLHFAQADAGLSPTRWQASTFPQPFRARITVAHDGIDTELVAPNPNARLTLNDRLELSRRDEIVTFVNRNLEPCRGFHVFMRALPSLLRARPRARVLIVGGDGISYGHKPAHGTWRARFAAEVRPRIREEDWRRVHFLGNLPYPAFLALLQLSTVHVYLTYPFVLSWSLLEAMSVGCAIVASDTAPLHEAICHDETGVLTAFFDAEALAARVAELLDDAARRQRLGAAARAFARAHYDLKTCCLPRQIAWVEQLVAA